LGAWLGTLQRNSTFLIFIAKILYVVVMIRRFLAFLFLFPLFLSAQKTDSISLLRSFQLAYENDVFTQTDYYYTGGTFVNLDLPFFRKNPLTKILFKLRQAHDESFGLSINNLGFTPTSIKSDSILFGDRPFAATLYLGFNRVSCNSIKCIRLTSDFDLGCIGPLAFGYETQKFIHENTNNPIPHGWQFQIGNDVFINYNVKLEKGLLNKKRAIDLTGYGFLNAGTVYDNSGLGLMMRIGRMNHYFVAPGFSDRFQCWLFSTGEFELIARDGTLEGGIFNTKSVYVISPQEIKRATYSFSAGIVFAYKKVRVEFFDRSLSPDFKNGRSHAWGHCSVSIIF
jgi:hypothetical protein